MRMSDTTDTVNAEDIFEHPTAINPVMVQELMIALHNLRDAKGNPAYHSHHPSSPFNLLFFAVLLLMEKAQPGGTGYPPEDGT
jgi:hypothetical protein